MSMTMLEYVKKCFPDMLAESRDRITPLGCPSGYFDIKEDCSLSCLSCWNRPLPEGFKLPKFATDIDVGDKDGD